MKKARTFARVLVIALGIAAILIVLFSLHDVGLAEDFADWYEEEGYVKVWVLCQPDSYVNVREFAKKGSSEVAMGESGDWFWSDLKTKNGFIHVFGWFEAGEGWINKGYVVFDEPEEVNCCHRIDSNGRVACRRTIGGNRRCWAYCDDIVMVYWKADEWAVTNRGFIKTEFINFGMMCESVDIDMEVPDAA
ncbi:MAG: hypothetical protein IKH75_01355 [Ruminococcus sp.]|nr:hypothetical protein [Ruminococcus sp.]